MISNLSSDELIGGYDEIKEKIRIDGYLEEFSLSRKEADELIMSARETRINNVMDKNKKTLTISSGLKRKLIQHLSQLLEKNHSQ